MTSAVPVSVCRFEAAQQGLFLDILENLNGFYIQKRQLGAFCCCCSSFVFCEIFCFVLFLITKTTMLHYYVKKKKYSKELYQLKSEYFVILYHAAFWLMHPSLVDIYLQS